MANELRHTCIGSSLTQSEYHSNTGHSFDSQAAGDILYASSSSQLTRVGKGTNGNIIHQASCAPAWTATPSITSITLSGDLTVSGGCIILTAAATDVDLVDNSACALSFDATCQAGILKIVTTNCGEGVTMSGTLAVTGALTATGGIELSHATQNTLTGSGGCLSVEGNVVYRAGGTDVPVADGGTGASTLTANGILVGNGTSAIAATATMATKGHVMIGDGSGVPTMLAVGTNCHVLTACSGEATGVKWAAASGSVGCGPLRIAGGSNSAPAYSFSTCCDTNLGFFRNSADNMGLSIAGSMVYDWNATTMDFNGADITRVHEITVLDDSGDPRIIFDATAGGGTWFMGADQNESYRFVIGTAALGSEDAMRITTARAASFDNQGSDFDYVCEGCGKSSLTPFECCGIVKWHDDVLALRQMKLLPEGLRHMVKLGVIEMDEPKAGKPTWVGFNLQKSMHFTWAALWQNRARMDSHHECHEGRIKALEARLGGCNG